MKFLETVFFFITVYEIFPEIAKLCRSKNLKCFRSTKKCLKFGILNIFSQWFRNTSILILKRNPNLSLRQKQISYSMNMNVKVLHFRIHLLENNRIRREL